MGLNMTRELGPQFIITNKSDQLTLQVGVKSSSLFQTGGTGGGTTVTVSSDGVEITAAEPLGAYRAVTHGGLYCDSTVEDLSAYAGVTTVALATGATGTVVRTGLVSDTLWTWTPNQAVFISTDGVLTQTPPALPLRRIGWAISATQINLDPFPIIVGE